jgi:hypothetical protein
VPHTPSHAWGYIHVNALVAREDEVSLLLQQDRNAPTMLPAIALCSREAPAIETTAP